MPRNTLSGVLRGTTPVLDRRKDLDMSNGINTNAVLLERFAESGVSLTDAMWYHSVARVRRFSGPDDVKRARAILRKAHGMTPEPKTKSKVKQ